MRLDEIPAGSERRYKVLVNAGLYKLGEGECWVKLDGLSRNAKFPVVVHLRDVGKATFRMEEVLGVVPRERDGVDA